MWGGDQPSLPKEHNSEKKKAATSLVEECHITSGTWEQIRTTGNPPLGVIGYATAVIGNEIFYFGGYCNHGDCFHNSLYSFNVKTQNWKELSPTTCHDHGPMKKGYCGMVVMKLEGEDYLAVIGGSGSSNNNTPTKSTSQYSDRDGYHFCNEIHYYKVSSGQYNGGYNEEILIFVVSSVFK